ncbi:DUF1611 domain-containing protein [soil metagenome]
MKTIKKTYICKDVQTFTTNENIPANYKPQVGDTGIFEVLHIGKHKSIQGCTKRNITIVPGDMIMAAFGTRYATEQFEGYVPEHVNQELHVLGAGGTVGILASMHDKFSNIGPTKLKLVALVKNKRGTIANTKQIRQHDMVPFSGAAAAATRVILSLGSSMDSGKTTSAAYLIHGLKKAGNRVAYIKLTGTVFTKDADLAYDLGADMVGDFGDFGFPSTYMCSEAELLDLYESLLRKVLKVQPDYVIIEIADGLYERETKMLLKNLRFKATVADVIFSAGDSLAAINGIQTLNNWGHYPAALCGLFTASPLLIKEVKENSDLPVYTLDQLSDEQIAGALFVDRKLLYSSNAA